MGSDKGSSLKVLYLIVGNIASGKSTIARNLWDRWSIPTVSRDWIRYMLSAGEYVFAPDLEPVVAKIETEAICCLFEKGVSFSIDDAYLVSKEARAKYIRWAKDMKYKVIIIEAPHVSKEESVKRRLSKPHGKYGRKTWEETWDMINNFYKKPRKDEGAHILSIKKNYKLFEK